MKKLTKAALAIKVMEKKAATAHLNMDFSSTRAYTILNVR